MDTWPSLKAVILGVTGPPAGVGLVHTSTGVGYLGWRKGGCIGNSATRLSEMLGG